MRQSSRMAKQRQSSLDEAWARGALAHLPRPRVHRLISVIGFENADLLDVAGPLTTFAAVNPMMAVARGSSLFTTADAPGASPVKSRSLAWK